MLFLENFLNFNFFKVTIFINWLNFNIFKEKVFCLLTKKIFI
ncbi:MAG: hypothetical protein Q616_SPPC00171G0001, partial [Streptococcus parasanguinis DORA_23_24]